MGVVGLYGLLRGPMASRAHPRAPGASPARNDVIRRRSDDEGNKSGTGSDDDDDGRGDGDGDQKWYEKHEMPFVAIGESFKVCETDFKRDGKREASCMDCEKKFGTHAYNKRALGH